MWIEIVLTNYENQLLLKLSDGTRKELLKSLKEDQIDLTQKITHIKMYEHFQSTSFVI